MTVTEEELWNGDEFIEFSILPESDRLQEEINSWRIKNFPTSGPFQSLAGMIEEICEEMNVGESIEEIEDSIADAAIFAYNIPSFYEFSLADELRKEHDVTKLWEKSRGGEIGFLLVSLGHLSHCMLKNFQGIRGKGLDDIKVSMVAVFAMLELLAVKLCGKRLNNLVIPVWGEVKLRDFTKNSLNGKVREA